MDTIKLRNEFVKQDQENGLDINESITPAVLFSEIGNRVLEEFKRVLFKLKEQKKSSNVKLPNGSKISFDILEKDDFEIFNILCNDILTNEFIKENTRFTGLTVFFSHFPLQIIEHDIEILDLFIQKYTEFDEWEMFLSFAYMEFVQKQK